MHVYDPLYTAFLYEFNVSRDYYECHEVLEKLWLEEGRNPYYQGLLQIAVALYHHGNGNVRGAVKLLEAGINKLEPYKEQILGIELGILLADARLYLRRLRNTGTQPFEPYPLDIHYTDRQLERIIRERHNSEG
ncbi:DUF309 domain-containing protein [Paenibacillus lutrae]|uniref:DUF309 domain-containing protein n=1 Tax=Paenibacillus lutrae TaxID=2078573 RepID=A0A7X3FF59_9BACL|nr:DUF309 domain-containing protein [Paenibacillus lutrae]MVO98542.1 DUF309 domain-containing protein [Paenibacillus lutrae]